MATKLDIKAGSTMLFDKNGYKAQRIAFVSGVTGTKDQKMYQAITDPGLPAYGSVHPSVSSIKLQSITAEMVAVDKARVTMSYYDDPTAVSGSSSATVRVSAGTTTDELAKDINGASMETVYVKQIAVGTTTTYYETFKADVEVPRVTYQFDWTETSFPKATIDTYLGKINNAIWNGYAVGTMLCTAVNVTQNASGGDYRVSMSLAYNADTWKFIARITANTSQATSTTDTALDLTTGTKPFDVYDSVDFGPLGLTL